MGWDIISGEEAGDWTASQLGKKFVPATEVCIGLMRGGEIIAGVIYEDFNGKSITCHIAISGIITPAYLAAIFDYPFNVCRVHKIIAPVCSDNAESIKLVTNMGFAVEATLKDAAQNGDILLFTIARNQCRFLEERYGKKVKASTPAHA